MQLPWHLYVMAVMYILAGINHFRRPRLYLKIIPPYFPKPKLLNALSGFAEIALGVLLCIPATSPYARGPDCAAHLYLPCQFVHVSK
jgi:uncharacterized membrane protein